MNNETTTDAYGLPPGQGTGLHSDGPATRTAEIVSAPTQRKQTLISRTAVKAYALGIAKMQRAGKFERVAGSFYIGVEAELDSKIRQMLVQTEEPPAHDGLKFTTPFARQKAAERIEKLAARIIYGKVCRHPSVGKTLRD